MPGELVFYTNPMSRGRIVRWMLEEVGRPYRTEFIDYGPMMKGPDYLAINPMGKVPALKHGETIVTECAAICAYLADAFPEAGLAPTPAERGPYYRWLFFGAGPLEAAVVNRAFGFESDDPMTQGRLGYGSFASVMDTLEKLIPAGGYLAGDDFSAADVYVGSQLAWGLENDSIEDRPGIADYVARIAGRPAYRRTNEIDDAALAAAKE